jgi:apolipoprotein N-acyltransferase
LIGCLAASAFLLSLCIHNVFYRWTSWLALVPLFAAIRVCRPLGGLISGVAWIACVLLFGRLIFDASIPSGWFAPTLLVVIPPIYCAGGAVLTRWIGYSPFVLGVGWMGVELALSGLGLQLGLLGHTESSASLLAGIARTLGFVVTAFLVAYVNAAVVEAMPGLAVWGTGHARTSIISYRAKPLLLVPQIASWCAFELLTATSPRAPPHVK